MPQKLCFLIHLKNPHTVPGGWSKTKVKKRTSTSEEIMPFRVISFVFKLHCIFCGETCSLKSDPCNPSRWQAAYLQIGLGVTLGKKSLVQHFHDLGICCSYDELLQFKASAAVAASNKTQLTGIQSSDMGLGKPLQIILKPISPHPMD